MTEPAESPQTPVADDGSQIDERKFGRGLALGLPLVTGTLAATAGVLIGVPMAILVLTSGAMIGVIALLWASLRVLSGDAPLSPEIEALDASAHAIDLLASRKKMLLLSLKDLENERAIGKLEQEDFEQVSATYRSDLKTLMKRIDTSLEPHRAKAESVARAHLAEAGLLDQGYRGAAPEKPDEAAGERTKVSPTNEAEDKPARLTCAKCKASNEPDAKFCKECGATFKKKKKAKEKEDDA
jgi:ribosomal protein L40E